MKLSSQQDTPVKFTRVNRSGKYLCKIFQSSSNIANTIAKSFAAKYFLRYRGAFTICRCKRSAIKTGEKLFKDVIARYCTVMKMSSMFMGRFIYNPRSGNSRRKRRCYKFVTLVAVFSSYIIFVSLAGYHAGGGVCANSGKISRILIASSSAGFIYTSQGMRQFVNLKVSNY